MEEEQDEIDWVMPYNSNFLPTTPPSPISPPPSPHADRPIKRKLDFLMLEEDEDLQFEEGDLQPKSPAVSRSEATLFDLNLVIPSSSTEMSSTSPSPSSKRINGGQFGIPLHCNEPEKSPDLFDGINPSPEVMLL